MIWVLTSDGNHCRIYSYQRKPADLKLVNEIVHPELRLKASEYLTDDRSGHYQARDMARGTYSPHTDPKEIRLIEFAHEISEYLDQSRKKNLYEKIIMIASPHINGLISQHLNKNVEQLITHNIKKDYMHTTEADLLKFLHENIYNLM